MAGATFSRVKNWAQEVLNNTDLNIEIDNILNHLNPDGLDDYSANIAQMRTVTDPGEVGAESLATSLSGEIERLRYEIKEIKGGTTAQWYSVAPSSLSDLRQLVGGTTLSTRVSSGRTTGRSSQLNALVAAGSSAGVRIDGTPTSFIYYVGDTQYIINDDLTVLSSLVAAPGVNNTAVVDDTNAAGGEETRLLGSWNTVINIGSVGSNISSLVGKVAGFKIVSASLTEYFTAYVESATQLRQAVRGSFFDSTGTVKPAITFSNGNTITLMKLSWLFLTDLKTFLVTYNEPVYAAAQPSSPATGDFWYDLPNGLWKRFDGSTFTAVNVVYVGQTMQDTANCVASRTVDRFSNQNASNAIDLERSGVAEVRVKNFYSQVSVFGTLARYNTYRPTWNMATDLDAGLTEASSTTYFLYIKETGATVISDQAPVDRRGDLYGLYHPAETWRYVGKIRNNASSDFDANTLVVASRTRETKFFSNDMEEVGVLKMQGTSKVAPGWGIAEGASVSRFLYDELYSRGNLAIGNNFGTANAYVFNLPKTQGVVLRGYDHAAGLDPDAAGRIAAQTGGATGDNIGSYQADTFQGHWHNLWGTAGQGANPGVADDVQTPTTSLSTTSVREAVSDGTNGTPRYGQETRMKNLAVQYVIKVLA